ncbi:MAG TPA: hypothetical protein V6D33_14635 [Cyanophyceae cyanobacterium]
MSEPFPYILPAPPPGADSFASHQLAYEFRREVQQRQEFELYCKWYQQTAEQHQQELQKMQGDINIFGWFCRRR